MSKERLPGLLEKASALAAKAPDDPRTLDLRGTLAALHDAAAKAPAPPPFALLSRALQSAALLATDGVVGVELVSAVAAAYNEGFPGGSRLAARAAATASPPLFVALRAPKARAVAREVWRAVSPEGSAASAPVSGGAEVSGPPPVPGGAPANDLSAADPEKPLRLGPGGAPVPVARFLGNVVSHCTDTIQSRARQRHLLPMARLPAIEAELLCAVDALGVVGGDVASQIVEGWCSVEEPNEWAAWALAAALSSFEGADALEALATGVGAQAGLSAHHARRVAEALAIFGHPDLEPFGRDLLEDRNPLLRAVGVELASLRGQLGVDEIRRLLWDANGPVLVAAARACERLPEPEAATLVPILLRWLRFPEPHVAWAAARALTLLRRPEPMMALREGKLAHVLPTHALELFVLAGDLRDLEAMQRTVSRVPVGGPELDAIARFGHAGAAAFLLHHLAEGELDDEAVEALLTLFGPLVEPEEATEPATWKKAIVNRRLDPTVRYRGGEPWSPRAIVGEVESKRLALPAIDARFAELRVRSGLSARVDVAGWSTGIAPQLQAAVRETSALSQPSGTWATPFGS